MTISALIGLAILSVFVPVASSSPASAKTRFCGDVHGYPVRVAKGGTHCPRARQVARSYIDRAGDCGQANAGQGPCRVDKWRCWLGSAGDQSRYGLISFCYQRKRSSTDSSFYHANRYTDAIKIGRP
jgi:hypothetical protein